MSHLRHVNVTWYLFMTYFKLILEVYKLADITLPLNGRAFTPSKERD